jgi:hypothetical protein
MMIGISLPHSIAVANAPRPLVNQATVFHGTFALLRQVEQLAFTDDWQLHATRVLRQGAHLAVVAAVGPARQCLPIKVDQRDFKAYVILPSTLSPGSSDRSRPGVYYDILVPFNDKVCRQSPYRLLEWRPKSDGLHSIYLGDQRITVDVQFRGRFNVPARPFLVGLSNIYLTKGHCLEYCPREAELGRKYASVMGRHHLTPIQNWVHFPPITDGRLDLDYGADRKTSFRDIPGLAGTGLVSFPRLSKYQHSVAYLQALERTIDAEQLHGRAWVYVRDEPQDLASLRSELKLYRRYAPSVRTMVTIPYRREFRQLVDFFSPNLAHWNRDLPPALQARTWPYASCMGSCGPNRAGRSQTRRLPGAEVGRPDFLIDRRADRISGYFQALAQAGAGAGLYYHAVEGYPLYRQGVDVLEDPWNFGGNGDGLLFYPGRPREFGLTEHQPLPSFRLKLIRQAIEKYW